MKIQPDLTWHYKRLARALAADLTQRVKRVDIQALAAEWEVRGVDLSYWQGAVDFEKLASMVDFVILRAGYGNDYIDPRVEEYRQGCMEHNIPFGLYWYAKPGKDHSKHALNFYSVWEDNPGQIYPVFDVEENGGLAKTPLESWLKKMYDTFNNLTGRDYDDDMTYTSPGFLNKALGLTNWLKHTVLWVAHWTNAGQPIIPQEWAVPGFTWKFWQWSAIGKGSDYGVSSRYVDLNRYNGRRAQFAVEFGLQPPAPPPGGDELIYRATAIPYLNVRSGPGTNYADVGDMATGSEFAVLTIKAGAPTCSIWLQIKGGEFDGKWVCLCLNGEYYAEPVG